MGRSRRGKGAGLQRLRTVEAPKRESTRPRKPSLKAAAQQAASGTSEDDGIVVYSSESDTEMETSSDGEASSPIEVTYRRRPTRRQPAPVKGGGKKKKKRRRGDVYDWSKLSVEIDDDDDVAELAAVAPDTVVLCRDGVTDQGEATHVLEIEGTKYSVHAPPEVILALYDRFVELGPEIEAKVKRCGMHASQMRVTSLEQLIKVTIINFMCYDPDVEEHPHDGLTLMSNINVRKVQGDCAFMFSCEKRENVAAGDAQKVTEDCLVVDSFPGLLPSKDGGRSTQPSKKFVELCGGAARAQEILELHIKRVALLCRICELVQGKPPAVVSWGENAMALVALLGDRVRVLGHHMHPTRALMVFQKNWAGLEYVKHVQGSDECLTAIAKELGMTLLREDGEIWYWRRLWKNDEAAGAEFSTMMTDRWADDGDLRLEYDEGCGAFWEMQQRWFATQRERAKAAFFLHETGDRAKGGDGKWWLRHEKRYGPSRFFGVRMENGRWVVRLWLDGKVVRIGTCDKEEDAARLADALRVVVRGEAPENFTESFVEFLGTGCDGDVPAALVQAALRRVGRVAVTGTESVGAAEARDAASSVEAKIAAAVAKPENQSLALMKLSDASQLEEVKYHHWNAAQGRHMERQGVEFVRCLALVDVENAELAMALTCSDDKGSARKTLWKRKCAAAALLGVVGLDPKKPPKKNGTGTCAKLERTPAHQHALDVASRWVAHTDAPDAELAKKYAEALAAIARDCVAKQQKKKKRRC